MDDIKKENGDGGGFGDGGGTVFTSTDAGIFTPTHGGGKKKKKKDKTSGIHRLADFINDNTPEVKSKKVEKSQEDKSFVLNLIKWVSEEFKKESPTAFRQQSSGTDMNDQVPRIDWKKKDLKPLDEIDSDPSEFDAKPSETSGQEQEDEQKRIRALDEEDKTDAGAHDISTPTGLASTTAPAWLNVQLAMPSGGVDTDSLQRGADLDQEQGQLSDDEVVEEVVEDPIIEEDKTEE